MTMVCSVSPLSRTATAAPTPGVMVKAAVGRLANSLEGFACAIAARRRRRLDQAALDALPFDLRKDLGWPAGDISR
ncbi:hypothetical protein J2045_004038 [Peteryoungia aggregata LMG 23059]|uniref:DUF1127 domain-containing protein n=1 Tax=Peteryoungia aggregata LMG 23059 TaxID=1368425 RepID=A0ABU0GCB3_9HYPH|nr:hypothetical protein [Peteryoungia aggregata]MDQ0422988.1 hypothetical protein [Peteryoungia aggregata LMG 23059]